MKLSKKQLEKIGVAEQCALCEYATPLYGNADMLCSCSGIVTPDFHCRKFRFDLLKYEPAKRKSRIPEVVLPPFEEEE